MTSRILVLVIASDFPAHYVEMQAVWRKNVANNSRFDVWFVKAKPERLWIGDIVNDWPLSDIVEFDREAMTIFVKGEETYIPGILNKTIEAIRACRFAADIRACRERALGGSFDYIWRTNLSSVLDYQGLLDYVDKMESSYAGGEKVESSSLCSYDGGKVESSSLCSYNGESLCSYAGYVGTSVDGYKFASGAGFLMSRNVVDYLIDNERLLMRDVIDDVAIGKLLEPRFGLVHIDRCWVDGSWVDGSHINCASNIFHFRCETYKHERTIEFMNAALQYICYRRSK